MMLHLETVNNLKTYRVDKARSLEPRRKSIHIIFGLLFCYLIYFDRFNLPFWIGFLILMIVFSIILKNYKIPFISSFIFSFEREDERRHFHLRGVITFIVGCILSYLLFPEKEVVISAIITLFVGDSVTALYGTFFGKVKYPWSPRKHVDASLVGILFNSIFVSIFFPFPQAVLASVVTFFFESFDIKFDSIPFDDNIFLPLITGLILTLI